MRPVWLRSFEMSIASSSSVPRTTGSSISLPSQISLADGSAMGDSWVLLLFVAPNLPTHHIGPGPSFMMRSEGWSDRIPSLMDFDLSEDQLALRDGARELLDGLASPERVRAHTAGGDGYDRALWRAMAEQGWLGIEVPEAQGGIGLGGVEVAVLCEELGRHAAPAP